MANKSKKIIIGRKSSASKSCPSSPGSGFADSSLVTLSFSLILALMVKPAAPR